MPERYWNMNQRHIKRNNPKKSMYQRPVQDALKYKINFEKNRIVEGNKFRQTIGKAELQGANAIKNKVNNKLNNVTSKQMASFTPSVYQTYKNNANTGKQTLNVNSKLADSIKKNMTKKVSNGKGALNVSKGFNAMLDNAAMLKEMRQQQQENNLYNLEMFNAANRFNHDEAELQRSYEASMANTAHQREVADLKAAGLNPILSANNGAAVPSGSSAQASNYTPAESTISALASLASEAMSANANITSASLTSEAARENALTGLLGTIYASDNSKEASMYSANTGYQASMLASMLGLEGTKYTADKSSYANIYRTNKESEWNRYTTDTTTKNTLIGSILNFLGTAIPGFTISKKIGSSKKIAKVKR